MLARPEHCAVHQTRRERSKAASGSHQALTNYGEKSWRRCIRRIWSAVRPLFNPARRLPRQRQYIGPDTAESRSW